MSLSTTEGFFGRTKGDLDRAIVDHNEAIPLEFEICSSVSTSRGIVWKDKGRSRFARLPTTMRLYASIRNIFAALTNRGVAFRNKGDNDRAMADFNAAIQLDSKSSFAFFHRAYTCWGLKASGIIRHSRL